MCCRLLESSVALLLPGHFADPRQGCKVGALPNTVGYAATTSSAAHSVYSRAGKAGLSCPCLVGTLLPISLSRTMTSFRAGLRSEGVAQSLQ